MYLIYLVQSGSSVSSIQQSFYSLNYFHNACSLENPCESRFVRCIFEGCRRLAIKPKAIHRQPVLPEHLSKLVLQFAHTSAKLPDIRDVCLCLLAYAGFLRFDEVSRLRWCDITPSECYFSISINSSKTDQIGKGSVRLISKTASPTCPCAMLSRYAVLADRDFSSKEYLFQNISHSKSRGYSLRAGSQLLYTRAREVILGKFKAIGVPAGSIGLHSLRIGGASAAVNNGVLENIIKFHGRWKSDSSKDFNCRSILILIPIFVIC